MGSLRRALRRTHRNEPMTPLKTGGPPEISSKRSCGLDRTNRITVSTKGSIGLKPRRCHSNTAVVHARYTARLVRQHRLDGSPFVIVEFVVHDLRLRFWSLNHAPGDTINPQRPIGADDSALILLPLSEPQATWQDLPPASSQSKMTQLRRWPLKVAAMHNAAFPANGVVGCNPSSVQVSKHKHRV